MGKERESFTNNYIKSKKRLKERLLVFKKKKNKNSQVLNKKEKEPLTNSLKRKTRKTLKALIVTFFIMIIMFASSAALATATYAYFANDISSPDRLINRNNTGTVIYSKNNEVLYQTFGAKYRELLDLKAIPDVMEEATIAAEDKDFYNHGGLNARGLLRALINDIKAGEFKEGGSSITQQLVKNALLTPERSISRKYKEIILSLEIERRYEKTDILKMYLNEIYYGEGAWGIQDAAKVYFNKEAKDLTLAESSMLAGLPVAPSRFSPINNPEEAKERQKYVLDRMVDIKMISEADKNIALKQELTVHGQKTEIKAPHFVMAVLDQIKNDYGEDILEKGGLRIHTSLDMEKQRAAEKAMAEEMPKLQQRNASNGSIVSSNPKTGEILAFVGSADWNNEAWGKVAIPFTDQQPGSSFKPFSYVTAMQKGWTATTVIKDEKTNFGGDPAYIPANYDGKFHGNVTLRKALANSYNIPAVKGLQYAGLDETVKNAKSFGLMTLDKEKYNYGLSLVLGGGDVRLIDMVTAYGTFANGGEYIKPKMITRVINNSNKDITIKDKKGDRKKVLDPGYAFIMSDILSDNEARMQTFGANSPLKLSRKVAAKTGTTNDYKDGWTMGYTPNLVTGVWIGNNDNAPMQELPGALGAGYVWHNYMETALQNMPVEDFVKPSNVVEKWVTSSGALANAGNGTKKEYFMAGTEPNGNIIVPPTDKKIEVKPKEEKPATPTPVPTPVPESKPAPALPKPKPVTPPAPKPPVVSPEPPPVIISPPPAEEPPPPEETPSETDPDPEL